MGSNDGRMKEQAAGGERRGEGGKEEGRFWIFHKDPTRYSLPYENDTLPSLPPSLPPFLLFRSNQIRGSRGTKEWTRFFPRPRRRIHSCSRHFIGPSIINFRSGEICFSEELFLRSNPYLSYLEFHSYSSVTIYLVEKLVSKPRETGLSSHRYLRSAVDSDFLPPSSPVMIIRFATIFH